MPNIILWMLLYNNSFAFAQFLSSPELWVLCQQWVRFLPQLNCSPSTPREILTLQSRAPSAPAAGTKESVSLQQKIHLEAVPGGSFRVLSTSWSPTWNKLFIIVMKPNNALWKSHCCCLLDKLWLELSRAQMWGVFKVALGKPCLRFGWDSCLPITYAEDYFKTCKRNVLCCKDGHNLNTFSLAGNTRTNG